MPAYQRDIMVVYGILIFMVLGGGSFVACGALFLDIVMTGCSSLPRWGEEYYSKGLTVGVGGIANQAVALARLGSQVSLLSSIGSDVNGQIVEGLLSGHGVGSECCVRTERQAVTVSMAGAHDRAMMTFEPAAPRPPVISGGRVDGVIGDLATLGYYRSAITRWRSQGAVVAGDVGFDVTGRWAASDLEPVCLCDVFTPNEVEAMRYSGESSVEKAGQNLFDRSGGAAVVVTCGGEGAYVCADSFRGWVPARRVARVVDTTGAGDAFAAGVLCALTQGAPIREAASFGIELASRSVEKPGGAGSTPTAVELRTWLSSEGRLGEFPHLEFVDRA